MRSIIRASLKKTGNSRPSTQRTTASQRLFVESLEDRRVLAALVVTQPLDVSLPDGLLSLREAVEAANNDQMQCSDAPGLYGCMIPSLANPTPPAFVDAEFDVVLVHNLPGIPYIKLGAGWRRTLFRLADFQSRNRRVYHDRREHGLAARWRSLRCRFRDAGQSHGNHRQQYRGHGWRRSVRR